MSERCINGRFFLSRRRGRSSGNRKSGTLKVATEDDYAPFNFMNNGQADGFNKDMLEELRKYAKFHVDQSILPWTGLLAAVSTGQYDMALTGAVITDERLKVFDFTPPWASAQHYFVKRAGDTSLNTIADLSGKKVGLQAGSALLARLPELKAMLEKTGGKLGPVVEYPSYPEAYADLANKRLDYVINVVISVNDLAKAKPKVFAKGLAVSGPGYMAWPIPKNSPQLLAYMTRFMNHMKETGKLAELQKNGLAKPMTTCRPRRSPARNSFTNSPDCNIPRRVTAACC